MKGLLEKGIEGHFKRKDSCGLAWEGRFLGREIVSGYGEEEVKRSRSVVSDSMRPHGL